MTTKTLVIQTLQTFVIGALILGLLLFLPAGTFNYWQAWLFIVVFLVSVNIIGVYLALKDPVLLERRKHGGPTAEQSIAQRIIISIGAISIIGAIVFPALDHRFGWSPVPTYVAILGDVLVALGLYMNLLTFRENTFGGSTVQIFDDQKVISTGPYSIVRHPMYVGVLVMLVGIPLALGSWWGLAIILLAIPVLVWRILDEEKLLEKDLPGYIAYEQKVRYRLAPYVW